MNVSSVGMGYKQPSFKGWITDGKVAFRDSSVKSIVSEAENGGEEATIHFYDGKSLDTRLTTNNLLKIVEDAHKKGFYRVGKNDFYV